MNNKTKKIGFIFAIISLVLICMLATVITGLHFIELDSATWLDSHTIVATSTGFLATFANIIFKTPQSTTIFIIVLAVLFMCSLIFAILAFIFSFKQEKFKISTKIISIIAFLLNCGLAAYLIITI